MHNAIHIPNFVTAANTLFIVIVHVDDCTIVTSSLAFIARLKAPLREHVEVPDLGELHWLLGIEVKHDRATRTIDLSQ
ncbi:hypothetical protein CONPUDRAFT_160378, partial [Coniophora puteana RWD-64-598 SS2]